MVGINQMYKVIKSSILEMLHEKRVLKNFAKFSL